jgi:hypothetical protein
VGECHQARVPCKEDGASGGDAVRHHRKVGPARSDDALEQWRVLFGVRPREPRRSHDHRNAARIERALMRSGVDAFGTTRQHRHARGRKLGRQSTSEAQSFGRRLSRSHDRHGWPTRELPVQVEP